MFDVGGFFDYCIDVNCVQENYESTIKLLYDFGYRTIAINQMLNSNEANKTKKKKGKGQREIGDLVPEPFQIPTLLGYENFKVLNRLTIEFSHQEVIHQITKSPNYKKYHIIGVLPTTAQATMFVCNNFDADIFCFNPETKNYIKRNRKMYRQLIDKGYHFEIPYSPAIQDTHKRKNIILMSHIYHSSFKSKNIIISSGATSPALIRNPYDVINLGLIFGLNEHQAKVSISECGRRVFINSVGRRHGKGVMFVENLEEQKQEEPEDSVILLSTSVDSVQEPRPEKSNESVICLSESEDDVFIVPAAKKAKL